MSKLHSNCLIICFHVVTYTEGDVRLIVSDDADTIIMEKLCIAMTHTIKYMYYDKDGPRVGRVYT